MLNVECSVGYRIVILLTDFLQFSIKTTRDFILISMPIFLQILSGQARSPLSNAIVPFTGAQNNAHVQIEVIDVKCENGNDILVTIDFDGPFSGIVYSQGYFNDPKCR